MDGRARLLKPRSGKADDGSTDEAILPAEVDGLPQLRRALRLGAERRPRLRARAPVRLRADQAPPGAEAIRRRAGRVAGLAAGPLRGLVRRARPPLVARARTQE